jgi:hypothetical protein
MVAPSEEKRAKTPARWRVFRMNGSMAAELQRAAGTNQAKP